MSVAADAEEIEAHLPGASLYASLAGMLTRTPVVSVFHGSVDTFAFDRLVFKCFTGVVDAVAG